MNKKFKYIITTLLLVTISLIVSFKFGPNDNQTKVEGSNQNSKVSKISDKDVIGVWVNHRNKDIHQQITFTKDHKWYENQHNIKNIYTGTWKIVGNRTIMLSPYHEKIVFNKHNIKKMNVVSYHHILTKNK